MKFAVEITMPLDYFEENFAVCGNGKCYRVSEGGDAEEWIIISRTRRTVNIGKHHVNIVEGNSTVN
jgi:hypothetical protein